MIDDAKGFSTTPSIFIKIGAILDLLHQKFMFPELVISALEFKIYEYLTNLWADSVSLS